MASRDEWRDICNVDGVDVDASTVSTYSKEEKNCVSTDSVHMVHVNRISCG